MNYTVVFYLVAAFIVGSASRSLATEIGELIETRHLVPSIYVFGDSLVDVGNNNFLPPPAPRAHSPYGIDFPDAITGRFTNGYNIADIVTRRLGFMMSPPAYLSLTTSEANRDLLRCRIGANYASGGSGILSTTGNGTLTLQKQILLFYKTRAKMRCGMERYYLLSQSLFLISAGGNDFSAFSEKGMAVEEAPAYIAKMVSTYVIYIKALYKMGARRVAILDVPPIGCTPGSRAPMSNGGCNDAANSMVRSFNSFIRLEVATAVTTSMPGMKYSIGSTYNVLSDLIAHPLVAGLKEVRKACCGAGILNAEVMCSQPNTTFCFERDEYMFWDMLHGTQATYERGVLAIFYGSQKYANPINFAALVPNKNYTMTPGVYSM